MKKLLMLLTATLICFTSQAQVKKKAPGKLTEMQQVKKQALYWFKNFYVDINFKDPYSYKLLKCDIYPVSAEEALIETCEDISREVSRADTAEYFSGYKQKKRLYFTVSNNIKAYPSIYRQSEVDRAKKDWDDEILIYQKLLKLKIEADSLLKVMDPIVRKKVSYYSLYIDCYSNNSYGNAVLGRYSLHFDKKGLVREPIQLNSED
jgi:hypothetical protein